MDYTTLDSTIASIAILIPPVVASPPAYPFVGVKVVKGQLEASDELCVANAVLMYHLQTEAEQSALNTSSKNKAGFMSSDSFTGSILARKLISGVELAPEESKRMARMGVKYSKQLCVQLRRYAMTQDAKLASYAMLFSVQ